MINTINSTAIASTTKNSTKTPQYLEDLAVIADSADKRSHYYGKFTDEQILAASEKLNAREYQAFGCFTGDASLPGIKKYAEAYLKYINSLSPEELSGTRYEGTKESMTKLLSDVNAQIANGGEPTAKDPSSLISMLLDEMLRKMKERGMDMQSIFGASSTESDKVTISKEAKNLSS